MLTYHRNLRSLECVRCKAPHVWHAPSGGWVAIRVQRFTGGVWICPRDVICVCVFVHAERGIMVSVHGDDFTCSGARPQLQWLETQPRSKYEPTVGARLGPGKEDDHEGLVLNLVVRWTGQGIEYEADPRRAEKLIRDTELHGANAVTTPGVKPLAHQLEKEEPLSMADFTRFRGQAARANYLGPDRTDLIYSAK